MQEVENTEHKVQVLSEDSKFKNLSKGINRIN